MVEQEAVNFEVAGSSPASGAIQSSPLLWAVLCYWVLFGGVEYMATTIYAVLSRPPKSRSGIWVTA